MKQRLDVYLVENGLVSGRDLAKSLIMAGKVYVNNQKSDKPGTTIKPDDIVEFRGAAPKYVSRGGLKLEKAVEQLKKTVLPIQKFFERLASIRLGKDRSALDELLLNANVTHAYDAIKELDEER